MLDALDMQVRLSALQEAAKRQHEANSADLILATAAKFYNFLTGTLIATGGVVIGPTVDPLPLAGEPPIETGAVVAANEAIKRTRRTKAEMEAARAAEGARDAAAPSDADAFVRDSALKTVVEATAAGPAPAADPQLLGTPCTIFEVKAAFMRVVETEGLGPKAGSAIIKQFGVERIASLAEKDFAAAVAACDAAVVGAGK